MSTAEDAREAAAVLRRLLDAVEAGELDADGPLGARVVRQLHGAVAALHAVEQHDDPEAVDRPAP